MDEQRHAATQESVDPERFRRKRRRTDHQEQAVLFWQLFNEQATGRIYFDILASGAGHTDWQFHIHWNRRRTTYSERLANRKRSEPCVARNHKPCRRYAIASHQWRDEIRN